MEKKIYILQFKPKSWENKWINLEERYNTLQDAKAALLQRDPIAYRIAEEYTVVRYKPIKI